MPSSNTNCEIRLISLIKTPKRGEGVNWDLKLFIEKLFSTNNEIIIKIKR